MALGSTLWKRALAGPLGWTGPLEGPLEPPECSRPSKLPLLATLVRLQPPHLLPLAGGGLLHLTRCSEWHFYRAFALLRPRGPRVTLVLAQR